MEENASPELSLAPEPEQSQNRMDTCSQGFEEEDREQNEQFPPKCENVAKETLEETDKSSKANSEVKKTWCFRRSTVAKREMPVEAATDSHDNRCPVRRSGRQPKRTDKLEEFLSTAKRGQRKSAPPSLESGDPPSQTPTDAETASEASFDGNADAKAVEDKVESPERRTRSGTRKQTQRQSRGGRPTRGGAGVAVKNEGSSENEEDATDATKKDQLADVDGAGKDEQSSPTPEDVRSSNSAQPQPEQDSERKEVITEKNEQADENDKVETEESDEETDEESTTIPAAVLVKRGPIRTYINKKRAANKNAAPVKSPAVANKIVTAVKRETKPTVPPASGMIQKTRAQEDNDDENDSSTSSSSSSSSSIDSDEGGYDPNALYCICRQKHNKRFMICCDRCEEWFHGDCVGITEARGRLMERNGEDYICPNCTAKKNQVVRPATSILTTSIDMGKARAPTSAPGFTAVISAEKTTTSGVDFSLSAVQAAAAAISSTTGTEEKPSEDLGIKGRIEKATNPTGKKKIKIFQPTLQQSAQPKADQKSAPTLEKKAAPAEQKALPDTEEKVASNVEVNTTPTTVEVPEEKAVEKAVEKAEEDSSLPKCIGPGCENNAQPDSVYCGNGCILRHAAAAMKSITDVKEPKQKDKAPKTKSTPKRSATGGKRTQKKTQEDSDSEEDDDADPEDDDDDDDDDEDEHAEEHPPPPATASWSSDHNYIAVTPEKTTPISATVLNKKSSPKEEKPSEKEPKEKEPAPPPETPSIAASTPVKGNKKSPTTKATKVSPKGRKASLQTTSSKASKKPVAASSKTAAKSKKPGQTPVHTPSRYPPGPIHVTGALRVTKSNFTIPKKQPQAKAASPPSRSSSSSSTSRVPSSPGSSAPSSHSSSSRPSHPAPSAPPMSSKLPQPNNQMRTNIRRSLTDILFKRVSDSDDLKMTESEVARLAVGIEKEMFNLCLNTDSKYKNKYRSLMFNLKDPKNKGLFYRVVGGEVSPFRLVRLSAEELLSKEISEWKKPEAAEALSPSARAHSGHSKLGNRHDSHSMDMEDAPPTSDTDDPDESYSTPSASAQASNAEGNSGGSMPDIFSTMLKDTTSEHRTHLFDLNCKICTGQKSDDEPAAKKAKLTKKPETKPPRQEPHLSRSGDASPAGQAQVATGYQHQDPAPYQHPPPYRSNVEPAVTEPQPQLDLNLLASLVQETAPVTPTVSSVTITRRDPRMARHGSGVTVTYPAPEKPINNSVEPLPAAVGAQVDAAPKAPLPMPPAPPPSVSKTAKTSSSETPPDGETAIFLHGQEKIWKGLINMQSVAKFVTKAYLVSGAFEHLKEDLPDTIHVGGRISPSTVWDYVGKLKTSLSKELCLIRFHPATEEEEVAYVSLFSYFSSRKRFGVVANNNRRIKDLYLIPLSSKDPLPSKLLPFDGPGLEPARPNLLLGLLICQKDRKRAAAPLEAEEKRFKTQTKEPEDTGLLKPSAVVRTERNTRQSLEISFSKTPPGSPPSHSSETSSSSVPTSSVFSILSSVKATATSTTTGKDSPSSSSSVASSAANATPLQTILKTLFGKKKHDSEASNSPSDLGGELSIPTSTMLDPIVQQFALSKEQQVEEDEDDRPYDPEEEYDPSRGYNALKKSVEVVSKTETSKQPEVTSEGDDVAYDPEDDSIFEDVKPVVPGQAKVATESIADPQKILESLKQFGEQAFQKQGEQQISSTGTPGASLTLPEALLSQPTKSLLASTQLLQLGKKVEELVKSSSVAPLINQRRDPRQSRDPRQAATGKKPTDEPEDQEETSAPLVDSTPVSQPVVQEPQLPNVTELADSSEGPEASPPREEVKSETLPFMQSDMTDVAIPLLGEEVEPDMEVNYMDDVKTEEAEPIKAETEMDKYSIWPNAASILKANEESDYEENSQDAASTNYYNEPTNSSTITSTIPVLTQSATLDSHKSHESHHMPHHRTVSGFDSEYRSPADIPPPSNFPPSHPIQGQSLMMRPLPMSMPPPMQGLPPMSGPPPMQGLPPPIHVPPPVRGPPMQSDNTLQYGPPPTAYPPYQNQWPGSQPPPQQQPPPPRPPPQNIMPLRGPPPPFPPMAQRGPAPQIFNPSIPPQHIGQQGLPPGLPPPPAFDGQNSLPPPRFTGPPPPFNYPANRGPPPPFTGPPPPPHFENRLPPPSHYPGPRGPPPSQYGDHGAQPPMVDQPRGPAEQYNRDNLNSFKLNVDQNPSPHHIYKDNHGPPPAPAYRGPPPNQYEDRRGPPSSSEMSGQHFNLHNQHESSRLHSSPPPPLRGSFDDHRGPLPQEIRPHPSPRFGGSERYRLDRLSDEARPIRHSGPLLPTPPEAPIGPPSRMGAHSPDMHRDDPWRRYSPEMRRRTSATREGSEPRIGDRFSRFEGVYREAVSGLSQPSEERQRELSEDPRREREREVPHTGRPSWDRGQGKRWSREREWDRARERDRDPERSQERDRDSEHSRERDRDPERSRERDRDLARSRERDRDPERNRERDRDTERNRERDRDPERNRERERDRDSERNRDRERDRDSERIRERDHNPERTRERDHDPERTREKERDPERTREKERDPERTREKERDPERNREKERDPERSREKERDQERKREKERDQERVREKDRDPECSREKDRDQERVREKDRDPESSREKDRDPERTREKERDSERVREKDRDPERVRERDRSRGREGDRHRDQDTDKRRDRERDRPRDSDRRDHDRDRGKNRDRERDRDRDRRRDRSRSRDRDRGKDRGRDREKERDKDKDRDRRDKSRSREKREEKKDSKHDQPKEREKTAENDKNVS